MGGIVPIGSDTYTPSSRAVDLKTTQILSYMTGGNNLSDLTDLNDARSNLEVYSIYEIDTIISSVSVDWSDIVSGVPTTLSGYGITDAYTKGEVDALTWDWSDIASGVPTTLSGYGITDAYTKAQTNALTWDWSDITSGTPTTLSGYGISGTKANFNSALSDGTFMYIGDAPTAHNQAWSTITSRPTTLSGYGITDAMADLSDDTTPSLSGDLQVGTNFIELADDSELSWDHTASGIIISGTVDVNAYGIGCAMGIASDGHWESCDADVSGDFPCSGLALESGTGSKKILIYGVMRDNSWNFTVGAPVYASTSDGSLTTTAPSGLTDQVQRVGIATSADTILFTPSPDVFEV